MIVKNISGGRKTFSFGRKVVRTLDDNQSVTLEDNDEARFWSAHWRAQGLLEITGGSASLLQARRIPQTVSVKVADVSGADGLYITIDDQIFELDSNDAVTGTRTLVDIGANSAAAATNLKTAINANTSLAALGIVATDVLTVGDTLAYLTVLIPDALVVADLTFTSSAGAVVIAKNVAIEANAREFFAGIITATGTSLQISTDFTTIYERFLQVFDSSGLTKNFDGNVIVSGGSLYLDAVGDVDIANGDKVHVILLGTKA